MSARYQPPAGTHGSHAARISSRGLGDTSSAFPLDYVFSGAELVYQATFSGWRSPPSWEEANNALRLAVTSNFDVRHDEENENSGSIFYDFSVRGDFRSINDVKAWMDGAVQSSGFPLVASMIRFVWNPRRDQTVQPRVGTPGVDPSVTTVPPGSVDTTKPPGIFDVGSAADWWGSGIQSTLDSLGSPLGISGTMTGLLIAGLALIFFTRR